MALISAFSRCLIPPPDTLTPPPVAFKNWNPGHYIGSYTTDNESLWNNPSTTAPGMLQRIAADTQGHYKGVLLRFKWTQLEGSILGDYAAGIALLKHYLADISAYPGRRLIIFIQIKTFDPADHAVPLYMRTNSTYADNTTAYTGSGTGQYIYDSDNGNPAGGGCVPNMHINSVRDRFTALMQFYASEFNSDERIEAIAFTEASINRPRGAPSNWAQLPNWYNNMRDSLIASRAYWSNVQLSQWINAPRSNMATFAPELVAAGIGLGMPDGCLQEKPFFYNPTDNPATAPGNVYHCQQAAGKTIIMVHMSGPALDGSIASVNQGCNCPESGAAGYDAAHPKDKCAPQNTENPCWPGPAYTRQQLATWAKDVVKATHVVWIHRGGGAHTTVPLPQWNPTEYPCKCTAMPPQFYPASDAISGSYSGKKYNVVTDAWIHHPNSDITTVTARPLNW